MLAVVFDGAESAIRAEARAHGEKGIAVVIAARETPAERADALPVVRVVALPTVLRVLEEREERHHQRAPPARRTSTAAKAQRSARVSSASVGAFMAASTNRTDATNS